jgi:hypothetical protein
MKFLDTRLVEEKNIAFFVIFFNKFIIITTTTTILLLLALFMTYTDIMVK